MPENVVSQTQCKLKDSGVQQRLCFSHVPLVFASLSLPSMIFMQASTVQIMSRAVRRQNPGACCKSVQGVSDERKKLFKILTQPL